MQDDEITTKGRPKGELVVLSQLPCTPKVGSRRWHQLTNKQPCTNDKQTGPVTVCLPSPLDRTSTNIVISYHVVSSKREAKIETDPDLHSCSLHEPTNNNNQTHSRVADRDQHAPRIKAIDCLIRRGSSSRSCITTFLSPSLLLSPSSRSRTPLLSG